METPDASINIDEVAAEASRVRKAPRALSLDNMEPLYDRVFVEPVDTTPDRKGMIYIPDTAKEKPQTGIVLAVGAGYMLDNGETRPLQVRVGDIVVFGKYVGSELEVEDKTILIVRESDLLSRDKAAP